jgi:hypothetical protein
MIEPSENFDSVECSAEKPKLSSPSVSKESPKAALGFGLSLPPEEHPPKSATKSKIRKGEEAVKVGQGFFLEE